MEMSNDAGALTRRRIIKVGGLSMASAAVLAACKKSTRAAIPASGSVESVNTAPRQQIDDIVLLRTASSLEYVVVDVYQYALDKSLLSSAVADVAKVFQSQHRDHAKEFEATTTQIGGQAFAQRNEVVWNAVVAPVIGDLHDEQSVLEFAYTLEDIAAATYQSMVTTLSKPALRMSLMAVGGVERRHASIIAGLIPRATLAPVLKSQTAATTTTAGPTTSAGGTAPPAPVYRVPGTYGPLTAALGPNSFEYSAAAS